MILLLTGFKVVVENVVNVFAVVFMLVLPVFAIPQQLKGIQYPVNNSKMRFRTIVFFRCTSIVIFLMCELCFSLVIFDSMKDK